MASVNVKTQLVALQRTVTSFLVGLAVVALARLGVHVNDPALVSSLTVLVGAAWYSIFHYLEVKRAAAWGWLLGKVGAPQYRGVEKALAPVVAPVVQTVEGEVAKVVEQAVQAVSEHTPTPPPPTVP